MNGAPYPECYESKLPVIDCSAEIEEIIRTLTKGIVNTELDYKNWCLRITLRSVRDLIDKLCEKTDNSNDTIISPVQRQCLDTTIDMIRQLKD